MVRASAAKQIQQSADRASGPVSCSPQSAARPISASAAFIPAIAPSPCYGLPPQHVGSLGVRRRRGRCLVVVTHRRRQSERHLSGIQRRELG